MFVSTLRPLYEAGKLGCLLFQFPPWFVPSKRSFDWLTLVADKARDMNVAVEFRHRTWIESPNQDRAIDFLREHGMTFVVLDGPWVPGWLGPEALTSNVAYIRLHGRNRGAWFKKGVQTVERYRYLCTDKELRPWVARARSVAERAQHTFVLFNNCFADYGVRNAGVFKKMVAGE